MATNAIAIANLPTLPPSQVAGNDIIPVVDPNDLTDPGGTTKQTTVDGIGYYNIPHGGRTVANLQAYLANNAVFNVKDFGALGNDSADDTVAIVATINAATNNLQSPGAVYFPPGIYHYTALGNLACTGLQLLGSGMESTVLKCTTSGTSNHALHFDAWPSGAPPFVQGVTLRDLTVEGNSAVTAIIYAQGLARCHWTNVNVREANTSTGIGFSFWSVDLCEFENLLCSTNIQSMTSIPLDGIRFNVGTRNTVSMGNCSDNTLVSCFMEGLSVGARLVGADQNTFVGGSLEANNTYDLIVDNGCRYNSFIGVGFESAGAPPFAATANISDDGQYTRYLNTYTNNAIIFNGNAQLCRVEGGTHQSITIQSGANGCILETLGINKNGSGSVSDSGTNTQWKLLYDLTNSVYVFPYKTRTSISVTASPFTFTNTAALPVQVIIQSGTVSQVQGKRGSDTWLLAPTPPQAYLVQPSDSLVVTYSATPSMSQLPVNGF